MSRQKAVKNFASAIWLMHRKWGTRASGNRWAVDIISFFFFTRWSQSDKFVFHFAEINVFLSFYVTVSRRFDEIRCISYLHFFHFQEVFWRKENRKLFEKRKRFFLLFLGTTFFIVFRYSKKKKRNSIYWENLDKKLISL